HVVVVVSEGAGQDLLQTAGEAVQRDESGNARLLDIGSHLKQRIAAALRLQSIQHTIKYIDPSYLIRSTTANPSDSVYSSDLARNAVHAGMAGRSGLLVGYWNGEYTHVPLREVVKQTRVIDVEGDLWHSVLECTGQPPLWGTG
ncbi:ATP-dependent 6-phosphofructokinase, partial [Candidatus Bipolaricaulota bacterium]|nr:ATP-dependent 6-phosphofructokinase [Candidatus Bipolaricaulota bacterium]